MCKELDCDAYILAVRDSNMCLQSSNKFIYEMVFFVFVCRESWIVVHTYFQCMTQTCVCSRPTNSSTD
jgi:hypothetical protein